MVDDIQWEFDEGRPELNLTDFPTNYSCQDCAAIITTHDELWFYRVQNAEAYTICGRCAKVRGIVW